MSSDLTHLILSRPIDDNGVAYETDIIDVASNMTIAALRMSGASLCNLQVAMSKSWTTFVGMKIGATTPFVFDRRPVADTGSTSFHFVSSDVTPWATFMSQTQQVVASDATLGLSLAPTKVIARLDGAGPHMAATMSPAVNVPTVVGTDVFGVDQTGTNGWARLMRVNADGSTLEYRAVSNHRVATPASDGAFFYWTECYGGSVSSNSQPNVEIWGAPYTSDPQTLASTATKLAPIGTNCVYDQQQLAQNGLFFAVGGTQNYLYRQSDAKLLTFTNGPNRSTWYPLYVTQSEYWSIEAVPLGSNGVALTRIQLAPW